MPKPYLLCLPAVLLFAISCRQYAFYQSPFQAATNSYKATPLESDSIPSAFYISSALFGGGANENLDDGVYGLNVSGYRSFRSGSFGGYYGLTGTVGGYRVSKLGGFNIYPGNNEYPNDSLISSLSGSKFYAGLGAMGSIYVTTPLTKGGEWRVVQAEVNWQQEFGDYLSFRRKLPVNAANLIRRSRHFVTIALNTDILLSTRRGSAGIKLGPVFNIGRYTWYDNEGKAYRKTPGSFSAIFHFSRHRATKFIQLNWGTYSVNVMCGFNYRLGQ